MSGVMYYGKSEDGSDAKQFEGFYVSPCGKYWGSEPFPKETRRERRARERAERYRSNK